MDISIWPYGFPNSWMVYFMENPKIKWRMTGDTPISANFHTISRYYCGAFRNTLFISVLPYIIVIHIFRYGIPVVPHKAVAEVSKIGNL